MSLPTPLSPAAAAPDLPRPEHPRPDFVREPWINLNGRWRFAFDPENVGEQKRWYRRTHPAAAAAALAAGGDPRPPSFEDPFVQEIVVPFPWESRLSGLSATDYKGAAWYQRAVTVPADWAEHDDDEAPAGPLDATGLPGMEDTATSWTAIGSNVAWRKKPYLCFGAVDWGAKVWVNGRFVGEHVGGYTPFAFDLSHYVRPGRPATVTVRAYDACDADTLLGKQTYNWYTHSGGIWQTVWLEGRPDAHIAHIHVTPHLEPGTATFAVNIAAPQGMAGGAYRLAVTSSDGVFPVAEQGVILDAEQTACTLQVAVPNPKAWSPEAPHLYDCTVTLTPDGAPPGEADAVTTYFGLRSITRGRWKDNPYEYVFLNGEPVYLRGALDQAFHPEALHAYPTDEAIRADVEAAKALGLNMLRCHIKVNDPRYYYWADRLGLLVMYDLPSASVYTPTARAHWEATFRQALERDYSHPSIFAWILFNETWGLEEHQTPTSWNWVAQMVDLAKELDSTRLVEDNSACLYDHVKTDINTWHFYLSDYDRARRHIARVTEQTYEGSPFNYVGHRYGHVDGSVDFKQGTEPFLNSEYAGIGASGGDKDISYSFKFLTTDLRRHGKICGYVYTELSDIEWEHNGLLNYDRSPKQFGYDAFVPDMTVADINGADFVGLDCPPCRTLAPGGRFSAPAFISHWDRRPLSDARLCWRVHMTDRFGETRPVDEGRRSVTPDQYGVTDAGAVGVRLPDEPCLATIALWLENGDGTVRARNYVNVDVHSPAEPVAAQERTEHGYALRFGPDDYADSAWPQPMHGPQGGKFGASGAGWVEYELPAPPDLDPDAVRGLRLVFEAGARTASNRIGWKKPRPGTGHYPQTEAVALPTDLVVSVNGVALTDAPVRLPDDPADARGALSAHLNPNFELASYGFLTRLEASGETLRRILAGTEDGRMVVRFEVPRTGSARAGGLNLYGARMGAHPVDPTLFLDL